MHEISHVQPFGWLLVRGCIARSIGSLWLSGVKLTCRKYEELLTVCVAGVLHRSAPQWKRGNHRQRVFHCTLGCIPGCPTWARGWRASTPPSASSSALRFNSGTPPTAQPWRSYRPGTRCTAVSLTALLSPGRVRQRGQRCKQARAHVAVHC